MMVFGYTEKEEGVFGAEMDMPQVGDAIFLHTKGEVHKLLVKTRWFEWRDNSPSGATGMFGVVVVDMVGTL